MSRWRRDPYRVMFPLGLLLAWTGVLHWVLHALGVLPDYRSVFHAIAQVQGFMTCLALGFLMTAIPRRTATAPPSRVELGAALTLPPLTTVAGWSGRLALSQVFWITLVVVFIAFVARRFLSSTAGRRPPNSFVWIPVALLMGLAGALLTGSPGFVGDEYFWLHQLGRLLLLQGMMLGLIAGVGGMALPLITRGDSPPDGLATGRDRAIRALHLLAAALLVVSFWIEIRTSAQAGLLLRAIVMFVLLVFGARIWRLPSKPGTHRKLVWLGSWMVPAGYALAVAFPEHKIVGMHVVFIGGFAMLGLSVALHVTLAHGDRPGEVNRRRGLVAVFGGLVLSAVVLRALVDFDSARFFVWLGLSAGTFLAATLLWFLLALHSRR
ncbi:MAG: hypothetical protein GTO33_02270 [Acidobacteria bacterium]|nr:hypothetical protein [Acidobacteriota bacterium]